MSDSSVNSGLTRIELLKRTAVGAALLSVPGAGLAGGASAAHVATPKKGGRLRVGFVGAGATETLDPNRGSAIIEIAMATMMFDKLFDLRGTKATLQPVLAEFMKPDNKTATVWTLRVRRGIEWHDGKEFTIDDVMYTFRRVLDKKNALAGASAISFINPNRMRKLDRYTVRLGFDTPFADPLSPLSTRFMPIVQNGATSFKRPIGTGAFKFKSHTPGKGGTFVANPDYHGGAPYVNDVQIIDIPDATARVNALLGGQVDAIEALPGAQVASLSKNSKFRVLQSPNGGHSKICFTQTAAPFTDVRVRQALRMLVDRPQTIRNAAFGLGVVGNDLTCRFDPAYAREIPQRTYDPERARALLKAAGQEGLEFTLESGAAAVGMLESAQVFAQNAAAGGVKVTVNTNPADTYYSKIWGNAPAFQDEWGMYSLHDQLALNYASSGPYNGFKYKNPKVDKLLKQAERTLDGKKRRQLYVELQRVLWNEGPDIVWGSPSVLDAVRSDVKGMTPSPVRPLGYFQFHKVWHA